MYLAFEISKTIDGDSPVVREVIEDYLELFKSFGFDVDVITAGESLRAVTIEGSENE